LVGNVTKGRGGVLTTKGTKDTKKKSGAQKEYQEQKAVRKTQKGGNELNESFSPLIFWFTACYLNRLPS